MLLLLSLHFDDKIGQKTLEQHKPEIIYFFLISSHTEKN